MRNKLETSAVLKVSSKPQSYRLRKNTECVSHTLMLSSSTRVWGPLALMQPAAAHRGASSEAGIHLHLPARGASTWTLHSHATRSSYDDRESSGEYADASSKKLIKCWEWLYR